MTGSKPDRRLHAACLIDVYSFPAEGTTRKIQFARSSSGNENAARTPVIAAYIRRKLRTGIAVFSLSRSRNRRLRNEESQSERNSPIEAQNHTVLPASKESSNGEVPDGRSEERFRIGATTATGEGPAEYPGCSAIRGTVRKRQIGTLPLFQKSKRQGRPKRDYERHKHSRERSIDLLK